MSAIALALGFLSLIGSLFIFLVLPRDALPVFVVFRDLLFWIALLILVVIIVGKYTQREATINNLRQQLAAQQQLLQADPFACAHTIAHTFRDELFERYYKPHVERAPLRQSDIATLERLCNGITFHVRQSLLDYFASRGMEVGGDVSVTVKLVVTRDEVAKHAQNSEQRQKIEDIGRTPNEPKFIITTYRDPVTYNAHSDREVGVTIFDIDKTTPYEMIVKDQLSCFVHDDLESMGAAYKNENTQWRSQYNASLAVPICYRRPHKKEYRCYGLLAADSLNRKKYKPLFNTPECKSIMEHAADMLAVYFLTLEMVEEGRGPGPGPLQDPARHET